MELTAICGTFGGSTWVDLANTRAKPSAESQGIPFIHAHASTLAQARNQALAQVETEWVCVCDADDELEPGYAEAMAQGACDLRGPAIRQIFPDGRVIGPFLPKVYNHFHHCEADCLRVGNWLVVGAVVRTTMMRSVGWRDEFTWSEDWHMWASCWKNGATVEAVPQAVYKAYWYAQSRNRALSAFNQSQQHRMIEHAVWGSYQNPQLHPAYGKR